jgi:hypothetical protein
VEIFIKNKGLIGNRQEPGVKKKEPRGSDGERLLRMAYADNLLPPAIGYWLNHKNTIFTKISAYEAQNL